MNTELIIISILLVISALMFFIKEEIKQLKNIHTFIIIITILFAAHYSYVEFIQKKQDREKRPPVFNIRCKLEKVGEADSCYWLKASLSYENKSDRRIYIILSSIYVAALNITPGGDIIGPHRTLEFDKDYYYSSDFKYREGKVLFSKKIDSKSWYDYNQVNNYDYIIKIPYGYDALSLYANVFMANKSEERISGCTFEKLISENGVFLVDVYYDDENGTIKISEPNPYNDSILLVLANEHGLCHNSIISQLYLKENLHK